MATSFINLLKAFRKLFISPGTDNSTHSFLKFSSCEFVYGADSVCLSTGPAWAQLTSASLGLISALGIAKSQRTPSLT